MKFAEIINGKVRYIGESPHLPSFSGNIFAVEIPDNTEVKEGFLYENGAFRPQTQEEITSEHRPSFNTERNRRFAETEWIRQRHADRMELKIDDAKNWREWLEYWQALRDMPTHPDFDPQKPLWPEKPE